MFLLFQGGMFRFHLRFEWCFFSIVSHLNGLASAILPALLGRFQTNLILRTGWHVLFLTGCSSPLCNEESVYNINQTKFNCRFTKGSHIIDPPTVPFVEQIFQVAVMLREGDTSPTDIPKFFGARSEMEAPSENGGRTLSICVLLAPLVLLANQTSGKVESILGFVWEGLISVWFPSVFNCFLILKSSSGRKFRMLRMKNP